MTIASKINVLVAIMALTASVFVTLFVGQRDAIYQRNAIVLEASSLIGSQPQLQLNFYLRAGALEDTASELLKLSPAIKQVVFYDKGGEVLTQSSQDWADVDSTLNFASLREDAPPLDTHQVTQRGGGVPNHLHLLSRIMLGEDTTSITLPVISVVDPAQSELQASDFAAALADSKRVQGQYALGYVAVSLSSTVLWSFTLPTMAASARIGILIVFLLWLITSLSTRKIMAPLDALARVADDIAAGEQSEPIPIRGTVEIREIATVFNSIITGLNQYRWRVDADRKILNLKIDERTEQLSQHRQELQKAAQAATKTRDQLHQLAYFDSITSLPNRRLFTEQLGLLLRLAQRSKQQVGLLLVDIDNFKRINDSLGTSAGDQLLKAISERLVSEMRDSDVIHRHSDRGGSIMDLSRMGGDEFTVVLNKVEDIDAALKVAERLGEVISKPFRIERQEIIVTSSIGIAIAPDHASDVEGLLRAADTAMTQAKQAGRNRALVYAKHMQSAHRERLEFEIDLRRAVEREELMLYFQPQVNGRTGVVVGAEALLRWQHVEKGLIPPFKWIPIVEELGLIDDVGNWVLNEACRQLVSLREQGFDLPKVSVNVSALQFHPGFVSAVGKALADTGLAPHSLELELTEGIMIRDQDATIALVQKLKAMGLRLSIDDFGTGYSSLSYLTRFPLDELKIDRSFVVGLSDDSGAELVRAIIAMGKSLGLDIVVEGVEMIEEMMFFRDQSVDIIQSFFFSEAVPVEQLKALLEPGYFTSKIKASAGRIQGVSISLEEN